MEGCKLTGILYKIFFWLSINLFLSLNISDHAFIFLKVAILQMLEKQMGPESFCKVCT